MLKRWFSPSFPAPNPAQPVTVMGDIHGCLALLRRALDQAKGQIVCVGDYIDRGPDSAGVLALLRARPDIVCLMGNHEQMMLDFLDAPETHGERWLKSGGVQTLASFGLACDGTAVAMRDALRLALGQEGEAWLRALPSIWRSGNVAVTHAGADPALPLEAQDGHVLRWGHPNFLRNRRRDGQWVVRGHVIVGEAQAKDGIISIDTGAYATGRLTLCFVDADGARFHEVTDGAAG